MKVKTGGLKTFESEEFLKWVEEGEKTKTELAGKIKAAEAKGDMEEAKKLSRQLEEFSAKMSKAWNLAWDFQTSLREDKTLTDDEKKEVFKNWWLQKGKPVEEAEVEASAQSLE